MARWRIVGLLALVGGLFPAPAQVHAPPCPPDITVGLCSAGADGHRTVVITVVDVLSEKPVAGEAFEMERFPAAAGWMSQPKPGSVIRAVTDARGQIRYPMDADGCQWALRIRPHRGSRFALFCPDRERLPARSGGYPYRHSPLHLPRLNELDVLVRVKELAQISGTVFSPQGSPVREDRVALFGFRADGGEYYDTTRTDADGSYRFGHLPPGRYRIIAGHGEQWSRTRKNGLFDPFGVIDFTWLNQALGLERGEVIFPTFFPSVVDGRFASVVELTAGMAVIADIRKVRAEVFSVTGVLRLYAAQPEAGAVLLEPTGEGRLERPIRRCQVTAGSLSAGGGARVELRCDRLPAGEYRLSLVKRDGSPLGTIATPISVSPIAYSFGSRRFP